VARGCICVFCMTHTTHEIISMTGNSRLLVLIDTEFVYCMAGTYLQIQITFGLQKGNKHTHAWSRKTKEYNEKECIHSDRLFIQDSLGFSPKYAWPNSAQLRVNVTSVYGKGQFIVVFTSNTIYSSHDVTSNVSCAKRGHTHTHLQCSYLSMSYFKKYPPRGTRST